MFDIEVNSCVSGLIFPCVHVCVFVCVCVEGRGGVIWLSDKKQNQQYNSHFIAYLSPR